MYYCECFFIRFGFTALFMLFIDGVSIQMEYRRHDMSVYLKIIMALFYHVLLKTKMMGKYITNKTFLMVKTRCKICSLHNEHSSFPSLHSSTPTVQYMSVSGRVGVPAVL